MLNALLIMGHATLGVLSGFLYLFVFVDILHATEANLKRIRYLGTTANILAFFGIFWGLQFYLNSYGADKAIIKAGDWAFAHSWGTEVKEHILILAIFLLVLNMMMLWFTEPHKDPKARKYLLWLMGILVVGVVIVEGFGSLMAYGLRVGLGGDA